MASSSKFDYLLQKIRNAPIRLEPYPHIIIPNFFNQDDYNALLSSQLAMVKPDGKTSQLTLPQVSNRDELRIELDRHGWQPISYPGAIEGATGDDLLSRPTGSGLVYKLTNKQADGPTGIRTLLHKFLVGKDSQVADTLLSKFGKEPGSGWNVYEYNKDLNGYEISPHPDVSGKLITYQVNLAEDDRLAEYNLATRLLSIKPEHQADIDRLAAERERPWGLWKWFNEVATVPFVGNTFFAFAPADNTYHAVKLEEYPETEQQRTMIRGFVISKRLLRRAPRSNWHPGNIVNL